jgi:hypothetical protein
MSTTGRSEMDARKIILTGAAHRHRGFLAQSPCAGGAASPGTLAATAEPPQSSFAPAAGQLGCCPESAPALDPRPPPSRNSRQPRNEHRVDCAAAAAAGANVATTAVKPGTRRHPRRPAGRPGGDNQRPLLVFF